MTKRSTSTAATNRFVHSGELSGEEFQTGEHLNSKALVEFQQEVLSGLLSRPKTLPCKYFYDARGSRLFEEICKTDEYYVTRTEIALLRKVCPQVAARVGPSVDVLEPGSGAGEKIRILFDALDRPHSFTPIDISASALESSTELLRRDYPHVKFHPLVADFTSEFALPRHFFERPSESARGRKLIFFPGSTISNFTPEEAGPFLARLRKLLSPGDYLFIGVDRIKDKGILERAYDDKKGATAAFNLNLLRRIKRELDTDLDPAKFSHRAFYNEEEARIEMHLDSKCDQTVSLCGRQIPFKKGESIHTENSYKYSPEGLARLANDASFEVVETYSDVQGLFGLYLCRVLG